MRKPWIVILIAVSIVLVGLLAFWLTFDVNHYRQPIEAQLENRLGRAVTLGPMDLALFPPRFQASDVVIADDPEFANTKPFITADQVAVSVKMLPLLRGEVEVTSVDLRRPVIELIKNQEGVWNFSSLRPIAADQEVDGQPQQAKASSLGSLSVEDGQVALTDRQAEQPRAVYTNIDLTLKDLAPDTPFSVQLGIQLPGKGPQEVALEGNGGPIPGGDLAATPFQGTLDLKGVRLAGLRQFLGKPGVLANSHGTVTGQTKIDIQSGTAAAEGEMRIQDAVVQNLDLGYPITAKYRMSSDLKDSTLLIEEGALRLGSTELSVTGTLDLKSDPVQLGLKVKTDNLSLAEVSRLGPDQLTGEGTMSLDLRFAGPVRSLTGDSVLSALNGQTTIAFDNLRVSGTNLSREIATVAGFLKRIGPGQSFTSISKMTGTIAIKNGVAQTDDVKATLDFGTIAATGSADLASQILNLRVNAVVNQRVSQEAGGTGIRGYMQTALANDQGELVVPVRVTGTFESPKVSPDLQSLAEMKLRQALPTSGNPAAGLPGVIGDILGRASGEEEQQSQTPPSEESPAKSTVERILEGLSGQQQKKQEDESKPEE